jgi:Alginate export
VLRGFRIAAANTLATLFTFVTALSSASTAAAQSPAPAPEKIAVGDWQLTPLVEVRVRGEYRRNPPDLGGLDFYGRSSPAVRDAWGVFERSRLGLGVERGAVRAQVTLQDARALGSPPPDGTLAYRGSGLGQVGAYEAYLEAHGASARPTYLRLGRQAVVWGEGRLIGSADFSPTGRSLDAVRAHVALGNWDFEALAAMLEPPSPLGRSVGDITGPSRSGVQLYGVTARWTLDPLVRVEAFGLARVSRASGALDGSRFTYSRLSGELVTGSLRVSGDAKGWSYGVEGAYQLGNSDSLALSSTDVSAWAAYAHVSKTLEQLLWTPTFRLAGSYASGDDGTGTYTQFDPLLADPQRFHGQMDLFAWSNMMDVAARASVVPWADTSFGLEYRYARLADAGGEWMGSYLTAVGQQRSVLANQKDADLGHELDVSFAWRPWIPFELRAGWSGLLLGDGARTMMAAHARGKNEGNGTFAPSDIAHYAFAQATLTMP